MESTYCRSVQLGATYSSLIFRLFLCLTAVTDGCEGGGLAHIWCFLKHSGGRTEPPLEGFSAEPLSGLNSLRLCYDFHGAMSVFLLRSSSPAPQ